MVAPSPRAGQTTYNGSVVMFRVYRAEQYTFPDAYTEPVLVVYVESLRGQTYVEAMTFMDSRVAVPAESRIDKPIDMVVISTERTTTKNGTSRGVGHQYTPLTPDQFPDQITELVQAYNALPGSYTVPNVEFCIHTTPGFTRVTLTSATHVWVVTLQTGCNAQVQVSLDGRALDGTLDPTGWLDAVQRVIGKLPTIR